MFEKVRGPNGWLNSPLLQSPVRGWGQEFGKHAFILFERSLNPIQGGGPELTVHILAISPQWKLRSL